MLVPAGKASHARRHTPGPHACPPAVPRASLQVAACCPRASGGKQRVWTRSKGLSRRRSTAAATSELLPLRTELASAATLRLLATSPPLPAVHRLLPASPPARLIGVLLTPASPPARSEQETEMEKQAAEWGKKHRPKKVAAGGRGSFQPKQNVRKNKGRKR